MRLVADDLDDATGVGVEADGATAELADAIAVAFGRWLALQDFTSSHPMRRTVPPQEIA
jgi:hypothetical protein